MDYSKIDLYFTLCNLDTSLSLNEKIDYINGRDSIKHRYICFYFLDDIRNVQLRNIKSYCDYEAVLVEFRILPHTEFLIRNMINKTSDKWGNTVICGNVNYDFMKNMCENIDKNIKVINTEHNEMTQASYSDFLCTTQFWNLLSGEKILIYQEDSGIFKKNIDDFIRFDYIGSLNWCGIGNGGFSLRTRQKMLDIINQHNWYFPEDVYFTKFAHYNGYALPSRDEMLDFGTDTFNNIDSLGGHQWWNSDPKWIDRIYKIVREFN
jgi:hypothetical protein